MNLKGVWFVEVFLFDLLLKKDWKEKRRNNHQFAYSKISKIIKWAEENHWNNVKCVYSL